MRFLYQISLFLFIAGACKPSDVNNSNLQTSKATKTAGNLNSGFKKIAEEKLEKGINYVMNDIKTMVLCKKVEKGTAPALVNTVHFLVIQLKDHTIIYEDRIANGNVEWYAPTQLKISNILGTIPGIPVQHHNDYLYDVEMKQKLLPGAQKF